MRSTVTALFLVSAAAANAQTPPAQTPPAALPAARHAPSAAGAARSAAIRHPVAAGDGSHDGQFTRAEWRAVGRRAAVFDRADTNKDGIVTPAEIRASPEAAGETRAHPQAKTVRMYR